MHTPSNKCSRERDPVKTASDVNPADIRYQPPRRMFKINNIDYDNYETIVVDNGSTDESVKFMLDNYPDSRMDYWQVSDLSPSD